VTDFEISLKNFNQEDQLQIKKVIQSFDLKYKKQAVQGINDTVDESAV
jgi:hypothetical protein